ncbi:DNA repair protein UVH3 [Cucumis melo var. makuwa]|uniref:DNA repair protein UVH3 n=1 Tax=Cucumis melo var. makuwa TaxID=1194695 RepID=A0A5A7T7G7_CUCMM|nr:DNA repair protein UVH3 [Cucumis melo var. makuwa]
MLATTVGSLLLQPCSCPALATTVARLRLSHKLRSGWLVARSVAEALCWKKFGWENSKADKLLLPVLKEYSKHETQLRLEAFYTFNERFYLCPIFPPYVEKFKLNSKFFSVLSCMAKVEKVSSSTSSKFFTICLEHVFSYLETEE